MNNYSDSLEEDLRHLEDEQIDQGDDFFIQRGENSLPLYRLKADAYNETYFAQYETELAKACPVIAFTRYGKDLCTNLGLVGPEVPVRANELVKIERIADQADLDKRDANREREREAFEICLEKIRQHNLPMKLVFSHYLPDDSKVLFFFTADSRVDFRELVKDLVSVFKMRIELRQIGVRDEARMLGGCGVCGRVLCCNGVTDKLVPVSIKMAKDQNLSLNSLKISGPCGRLLCCLAYEYGFYKEARKTMPMEGTRVFHDGVMFRVIELNIPAGRVRLLGDDGRYLDEVASNFSQQDGRWVFKASR